MSKKVVFSFGRFVIPHLGHYKLFNKMRSIASLNSCPMWLFPSPSYDSKENMIPFEQKIQWLRIGCPDFTNNIATRKSLTNPFKAVQFLLGAGYDDLIMVVGGDRVDSFKESFKGYMPEGKSIRIVSAGDRNLNGKGVEAISSSNLRELAKMGDQDSVDEFRSCLVIPLRKYAVKLINSIRKGLGLKPLNNINESYIPFNRFK